MVSKAIFAHPTKVEVLDGVTWRNMEEPKSFGADVGDTVPTVDVTHLGSLRREYRYGLKDGSEYDLRFNYRGQADPNQTRLREMAQASMNDVQIRVTWAPDDNGVQEVWTFAVQLLHAKIGDPQIEGYLELSIGAKAVSDVTVTTA